MIQTLEIISVNLWQILISLANLLIIFLILKKFLWKPVTKAMQQRQDMVDKQFAEADAAQAQANADKAEWSAKLATADAEAKARIADADDTARRHGERIVADAKSKAEGILRQAEAEAALERKKAEAAAAVASGEIPETVSAGKEQFLKNKADAAQRRKEERARKRTAEAIAKTEAEIEAIDAEMAGDAAADYKRLSELQTRKDELEEALLLLYEEEEAQNA